MTGRSKPPPLLLVSCQRAIDGPADILRRDRQQRWFDPQLSPSSSCHHFRSPRLALHNHSLYDLNCQSRSSSHCPPSEKLSGITLYAGSDSTPPLRELDSYYRAFSGRKDPWKNQRHDGHTICIPDSRHANLWPLPWFPRGTL